MLNSSFNPIDVFYTLYDDMNSVIQTNTLGDNVFVIDQSIFTPPTGATSYNYVIEVSDSNGCSENVQVLVPGINCIITQAISPNDDPYNQSFDLTGYNVSSIENFNRNGVSLL